MEVYAFRPLQQEFITPPFDRQPSPWKGIFSGWAWRCINRDFAKGVAGTVSATLPIFFYFPFSFFLSVSIYFFLFLLLLGGSGFFFFPFFRFSSVSFRFLPFYFQKNGETPFARPFCETPKRTLEPRENIPKIHKKYPKCFRHFRGYFSGIFRVSWGYLRGVQNGAGRWKFRVLENFNLDVSISIQKIGPRWVARFEKFQSRSKSRIF